MSPRRVPDPWMLSGYWPPVAKSGISQGELRLVQRGCFPTAAQVMRNDLTVPCHPYSTISPLGWSPCMYGLPASWACMSSPRGLRPVNMQYRASFRPRIIYHGSRAETSNQSMSALSRSLVPCHLHPLRKLFLPPHWLYVHHSQQNSVSSRCPRVDGIPRVRILVRR